MSDEQAHDAEAILDMIRALLPPQQQQPIPYTPSLETVSSDPTSFLLREGDTLTLSYFRVLPSGEILPVDCTIVVGEGEDE